MRHINDHMDDIFQKAAEEYPLRTGTPNWESVQEKLLLQSIADKDNLHRKFRQPVQKWLTIALLIFIPLSTPITLIVFNPVGFEKNRLAGENTRKAFSLNSYADVMSNSKIAVTSKQTFAAEYSEHLYNNSNAGEILIADNKKIKLPEDFVDKNKLQLNYDGTNPNTPDINNFSYQLMPVIVTDKKEDPKAIEDEEINNPINIKRTSTQRFYAGIFTASEVTSVKGQPFRKPGFNGGFLVGYNFNRKFQAEAGVILSRKYYFSDGKYIAPNSLREDELPIDGINVYSKITELPVTLRYNIKNSGDNKLFVAAGAVANIVNEERYNYGYTKNGRMRKGFKMYNESADNLISNLHVSVGYEKSMGNIGDIRIEPYYRIPINGIGAGNLPVTSAGINIGLIKHFK